MVILSGGVADVEESRWRRVANDRALKCFESAVGPSRASCDDAGTMLQSAVFPRGDLQHLKNLAQTIALFSG